MVRQLLTTILLLVAGAAHAQPDWKLRKNENGIRVYVADDPSSPIKQLKVECTVEATLPQLVACIMDVAAQPAWIYNTRLSQPLDTVAPNELVFYSQVNMPTPVTDRDFISRLIITQPGNGKTILESSGEPDYLPHRKGFVRIERSNAHWEVTPINASELAIVYTLHVDPSGSMPPALVNLFLTTGPLKTFTKLREQVAQPKYKAARVPFIK